MAGTEVLLTYKRKRLRSARCSIDSASVVANGQEESAEGNNIESCTDVSEPAPEEKRLCSGIVKLQRSLSSPKTSREEDKSDPVHDSDRMTCDPSEVQDESPVEGRSEKALCDPVSLYGEGVSNTIKGGSCSASLQKSGEKDKTCPEGTVVTVEDMPVDMVPKNKLNLPLITFHRRSKQKSHSETLENDSALPVTGNCLLTTGDCKSTDTLPACEATASKSCSVDALENPCLPKTNLTSEPGAFTQSQEKKAAGEVDSSCGGSCSTFENGSSKPVDGILGHTSGPAQSYGAGSCSTFENGSSSKPVDGTLGNTSGAVQSHGAGSSQNSGFTFSSLQAKNGVDFQETPSVEKSPGLCNNYTNQIENDDVILSSKSTEETLDLSICSPAKVDDSKTALEQEVHGEPIIDSLLPSINGNLNPPILEVPNKDHESELLHKKPENGNSNLTHQVNHCSSAGTIVEKNNQVNFAPALKHTCLQLFPENVSDQRNYWQEALAHSVSEERPINLHQIRTQARTTATPVSSRYLGLPMEARLKNLACNSSLSLWQTVGMQSTGLIPETKLQYLPDQLSSFTRHQMILDKIATRSISLNRIRSNHLEKNDNTPIPWSEEELDSLWIGVRRYGRGNWDAMLRDPRLHFLPWRAPTELAVQWEMEQHKLLNHMTFRNPRQSKAPNVVRDCSDYYYIHPRTGKQNSADEVQLSLGDVYSEPKDRLLKRLGYLSAQNDVPRQVQESVADFNPMYLSLANQRRAMLEIHAAQGVNSSFPHWLKEVGVPPRTNDTALHSVSSSTNHGDIRRVNHCGLNSSGESVSAPSTIDLVSNRITVVQNSNATQPGNCQRAPPGDEEKVKVNQPNNNTMIKEEEVITLNSGASSEETISDDQSGRPLAVDGSV